MNRQYIRVRFRPGGAIYTYHNDGEPIVVGERVKIDGRGGWQICTVEAVTSEKPKFDTKPIAGMAGDAQPTPEKAVDDLFSGGSDANPA